MIHVNGKARARSYRLREKDEVSVILREPKEPEEFLPAEIKLAIALEDEHLLVVDKPAGLVVHPAPGTSEPTLAHALLAHVGPSIADVGEEQRCGIVHRLDRQTSGLLIVAKTSQAFTALSSDLAQRKVQRRYIGIATGQFDESEGEIDKPIGRRRGDRKRMGVILDGRPATTSYRVLLQAHGISLMLIRLHTGRTHQIRVHLKSIGRPILGDPEYGWSKQRALMLIGNDLRSKIGPQWPRRQLLHAAGLRFTHPGSGADVVKTSPIPDDMVLIKTLVFEDAGPDLDEVLREDLLKTDARPKSASIEEDLST